jgi:hypothetical protein
MTIPDELSAVLRALESLGVQYALTGSLASTTWGRPRATYDADVLVAMTPGDVPKLLTTFPQPDWYFDRETAIKAINDCGEFNVIHGATGTKIDFWVADTNEKCRQRFLRRRRELVAGVQCWVLSPEDTILAKLEWIKMTPSDRQQLDLIGILAVQRGRLDMNYLRDWAGRLGVGDLFAKAKQAEER